ncbi:hypothetical protein N7478_010992 [Penicillium angulare]|uniref:uncharacterized protein n=1 Tax=Penicillium angulare TaxID=116970 RepID=UPI00253F77F1|nr:uncharacterized protein N7478_010992 [Penicillium angulare]KAJ5263387.1 hypothetical protein N7478_010992 [Penicillium angulare]
MAGVEAIFGPPPDGIDLNQNKTPQDNAIVVAIFVLTVFTVALRFFTQIRVQKTSLQPSDFLILSSLFPLIGLLLLTILAGNYGLGKHVWVGTLDDVVTMNKILFAYIYVYFILMVLIKCSILMFYRRTLCIGTTVWVCLGICLSWAIGCAIAFSVSCLPPSYFWEQYQDSTGGKCVTNLYAYYLGNAAANVFTDIMILFVPLPTIWRLQMRTSQKVFVSSIFLLGGFVCVASIMRIYYMSFLNSDVDVNWIMSDVYVWSTVEPSIGIICACLPTFKPLLRWTFKALRLSLLSSSSKSGYTLNRLSRPDEGPINDFSSHRWTTDGYGAHRSDDDETGPIITANAQPHYSSEGSFVISGSDPLAITVEQGIHWSEDRLEIPENSMSRAR